MRVIKCLINGNKKIRKFVSDYKLNNSDSEWNEASSLSVYDSEETFLEGLWQLQFDGKGSELFGIFIDNFFCNID